MAFHSKDSDLFTENLVRENLLRWLSPSDPSRNHNIASKARHDGTAQWFLQGHIFNDWKSVGSLLWVHGKRVFLLFLTLRPRTDVGPNHLDSVAGSGKSVLWFVLPPPSYLITLTPLTQFLDYPTYSDLA